MSASTDIGTLIVRTPGLRGGRPHVAGTGVSVQRIATWYQLGVRPEEISRRIGHLTDAQVFAALACYFANRAAIDAEDAAENAVAEALQATGSLVCCGPA